MSRLPIRLRLTLAFALALAAMLAATGAFLYLRLSYSLDETLDEGLEARAADLAVVAGDDPGLGATGGDESIAQVLDADGRIVDATPQVADRPLLDADERARVRRDDALWVERDDVPGLDGPTRLLAVPVAAASGERVLVVGASLEERDEALQGFLGELLVVGPAALVLGSLLGFGIATAALRPVESMRAEAAHVSGAEPGRRLTLPRSRDEVRRLGETLNAMLGRLESALERERAFVANASHELRTPLALLSAELELALRRPRPAAELAQALRSAAAETERLVRLAEDLLVLARADQGRLPLHPARVSAREVVERVAERFAAPAAGAGRTLEVDAPSELGLVADSPRLEQALGNLVDNALRYGRGPIRLSAVEHDGAVELHVADGGAGFAPAFLPRAFERFSRADEARAGGGAGLGLALVDAVARAHGGSAHAANREEGGADVWIAIPRGRADP